MRELKFRVWHKKYKFFIGWERFGYLGYAIQTNGDLIHLSGQYPVYNLNKEDYEIQQYTGLKDKNGKEIYEGYLLKYTMNLPTLLEIYWNNQSAKFNTKVRPLHHKMIYMGPVPIDKVNNYEIIGNIFENPELINEN